MPKFRPSGNCGASLDDDDDDMADQNPTTGGGGGGSKAAPIANATAATAGDDDVQQLHTEIERLSRELDQASSEKVQSAKYGLSLLEEKGQLQTRCEELEVLYENAKHELDITQEALTKFHTSQKVTAETGIEQEDALLNESAAKESSLTLHIMELETDTKQVGPRTDGQYDCMYVYILMRFLSSQTQLRHELDRVRNERDRMLQENSDIGRDKHDSETEKTRLKAELKDLKFRETRLLTDYSELEEENISLQKQVASLRISQVDFESAKYEIRQCTEEIELLNFKVEELSKLKQIAEKQMEEALEALQVSDLNACVFTAGRIRKKKTMCNFVLAGRTRVQVRAQEGARPAHQPRVHVQHQQSGVQHSQ